MSITILGHHLEVTPAIREYVLNKVSRVLQHLDHLSEPTVQLFVEKHEQRAQITLRVPGKDIHCEARGENVYAAIDLMVDKLDRQIVKHKELTKINVRPHQDQKRQAFADLDT